MTSEQKPKHEPTFGGVIIHAPFDGEPTLHMMVEMHAQPSLKIEDVLSSGIIPDTIPETCEFEYRELVLMLIASNSPIVLPDYLSVESADYVFNHGPEIIGKILGSQFWLAEKDDHGTVVVPISRDDYIAYSHRKPDLVHIIPDFMTLRPQYYRELVGGSLEKIVR